MKEVVHLTKDKKVEVVKKMYLDINYFAETVLPGTVTDKTPPFHQEIYNYLERDDIKKLGIICPRGHGKSTLACKIYVLYQVAFNRRKFIIIVSESLDQSINLLRDVKDELEYNNLFQFYFGNLVGDKWTETDIITANSVRVWARGSHQRIRGSKFLDSRPDLIILDDFESEFNTETPEQRHKLKRWVNGTVLPAPDPKRGKIFLIGTIIHADSYLSDIKNDDDRKLGWYRRMYKAGLPESNPLWPERYPLKELNRIRNELAAQGYEHIYYQEYENEAITPGTGLVASITHKTVEYAWSEDDGMWFIKDDGLWYPMYTFMGLDPSRGTLLGDATGMVILGHASNDRRYVLRADGLRLGTYELLDRIFVDMKNWHCRTLSIETIAFQEILRDVIYEEMRKRKQFFGIKEYKPKDSKGIRLQSLSPYYYSGSIYHTQVFPDLEHQLKSFPKCKGDDLLDGEWYAFQVTYKPSYREYKPGKNKGKSKKRQRRAQYNWATGARIER